MVTLLWAPNLFHLSAVIFPCLCSNWMRPCDWVVDRNDGLHFQSWHVLKVQHDSLLFYTVPIFPWSTSRTRCRATGMKLLASQVAPWRRTMKARFWITLEGLETNFYFINYCCYLFFVFSILFNILGLIKPRLVPVYELYLTHFKMAWLSIGIGYSFSLKSHVVYEFFWVAATALTPQKESFTPTYISGKSKLSCGSWV